MSYSVSGNRLICPNGKEVVFEFDIKETLEVEAIIVVVVSKQRGVAMPNNVYGVSHEGDIVWQIHAEEKCGNDPENCFFAGINCAYEGQVILFHYGCLNVWIDPATGEIQKTVWTK